MRSGRTEFRQGRAVLAIMLETKMRYVAIYLDAIWNPKEAVWIGTSFQLSATFLKADTPEGLREQAIAIAPNHEVILRVYRDPPEIVWHGPPVTGDDLRKVIENASMLINVDGITPDMLVPHAVRLDEERGGKTVILWGENDSDAFHAKLYPSKTETE